MSNQSSASSIKELTLNELKLNYKKYIELSFLENILLDVIQPSQDDDDDNDDDDYTGRIAKQDDKILTKYLKTLTTTTTSNNDDQLLLFNEIEQTKLDSESKHYLTDRLNHVLTNRVETINSLLVNTDLNEIIIISSNNNNNLIMKQDDQCVTAAIETSKLIQEMLNTYRIGFYLNENKLNCQLKLTECDTFMAKIRTVLGELNDDLYMSDDKLQALSCIRNLIDLNTHMLTQKLEQINDYLSRFKSLGNEFNDLLANYKSLRMQLERSRFALNKLKENN